MININNRNQKNKRPALSELCESKGFTLVETMVAVFILALVITSMLSVVSSDLYSIKYSKNDMIANYLMQEAMDYIKNDRDNFVIQRNVSDTDIGWQNFLTKYDSCKSSNGCIIDMNNGNVSVCQSDGCKAFYYNDKGGDPNTGDGYYYTYEDSGNILTTFKRSIFFSQNSDEVDVKITVEWKNGNLTRSKVLQSSLLKWQ
jgi:prepilin-type N-terminal cleavage/methylation domain-containing protein